MGLSGSKEAEPQHWSKLASQNNGQDAATLSKKLSPAGKSKLSVSAGGAVKSVAGGQATFFLHAKAGVLLKLSYNKLWDNFLMSSSESFALTPSEVVPLLTNSRIDDSPL
jgi:hypothetical protein